MTTCRDACQKMLELLALDHLYLIIRDAMASHESIQFQRSLLRLLSLPSPVQSAHAPMDFDEHESDWSKANVELMILRLKNDEWADRRLPITPAVDTGGSRTSARGRVIAQARAGRAAAVDATAAKAARTGASRARRTYTHTFTYFAGEGGTCRCLALHVRAPSLSARARMLSQFWAGRGCRFSTWQAGGRGH